MVSEKAEIVEANLERRFRSERAEYPYPLVIRLVKYVEIPRRLRKHVTNAILFARDNYRCQYCSKHRNDLGTPRPPHPRPRKADLTRRHEHLGERGHRLHQVQRQKGQPPPHGMRHVPQEHPQRTTLRSDGLVLARPQRSPTPIRGSVLRRPDGLLARFGPTGLRLSARQLRALSARSCARLSARFGPCEPRCQPIQLRPHPSAHHVPERREGRLPSLPLSARDD